MLPANFTPTVLRYKSVESTNLTAREIARKGGAEGTVICAESQSGGRGRGRRIWHSPPGGLYVSLLLYPREAKRATDLALIAGLAMAQAVKDSLPKSIDVTVKWPNDCLMGWKKVGGVLCESLGEEYFHFSIVGIGLNINIPGPELEPFKGNPFSATSFLNETGGHTDLDLVLNTLLSKLFNLYRLYHQEGFTPIQFLWERNCAFVGKKVELRESGWREEDKGARKSSGASSVGVTVGTFLGIDEAGGLVLSNAKGERRHYVSGEITCFWP